MIILFRFFSWWASFSHWLSSIWRYVDWLDASKDLLSFQSTHFGYPNSFWLVDPMNVSREWDANSKLTGKLTQWNISSTYFFSNLWCHFFRCCMICELFCLLVECLLFLWWIQATDKLYTFQLDLSWWALFFTSLLTIHKYRVSR